MMLFPLYILFNGRSRSFFSKTGGGSIDANYLLKLETFLIRFDESKGTCMRSSERGQLFPGNKKKKQWSKKSGIYLHYFFVPCHAIKLKNKTDSIGLKPRIIEKIYTNLAKSFFRSQIFFTE